MTLGNVAWALLGWAVVIVVSMLAVPLMETVPAALRALARLQVPGITVAVPRPRVVDVADVPAPRPAAAPVVIDLTAVEVAEARP